METYGENLWGSAFLSVDFIGDCDRRWCSVTLRNNNSIERDIKVPPDATCGTILKQCLMVEVLVFVTFYRAKQNRISSS